MALNDIDNKMVEASLKRFDRLGREQMRACYGGGFSNKWYVRHDGKHYDQKLLLRGAHELGGLGPLPAGRGTFTAAQARKHLKSLGYCVVSCTESMSVEVFHLLTKGLAL